MLLQSYNAEKHYSLTLGVQGWRRDGDGSIPRFGVIIMWVEFVGPLFCTERFSPGTPVSPQHFEST